MTYTKVQINKILNELERRAEGEFYINEYRYGAVCFTPEAYRLYQGACSVLIMTADNWKEVSYMLECSIRERWLIGETDRDKFISRTGIRTRLEA